VSNGMAGAIIVKDTGDTFADYVDQVLIIQRLSETLPFPAGGGSGTIVLNGLQNPTMTMKAGEIQRWRFVNATGQLANAFRIGFAGPPEVVPEIYLIAVDGVYISNEEWETEESDGSVFLAPGNRVDVLVQANEEGSFSLAAAQTHSNEKANATRTPSSTDAAAAPAAFLTLQVEGSLAQPMRLPNAMPELPSQLAPIPNSEISRQRTLTFSLLEGQQGGAGQGQAPVFAIDGQLFDPCRVDQCLTAGTAEEWTVINSSSVAHPFHIHVNPFFITAYNDPALNPPPGTPEPTPTPPTAGGSPVGQWQDTILVPAAANGQNGSVTFRHRFPTDITGKFVLHCHILGHEDRGMMQVVEIVPPGEECTACA
jgi:FtsP/CotA-like multicopper oxidase with cupredoxin domain